MTAGLGKRLSLQLGGRTPVLIFESADLDSAATELTDTLSSHRGLVSQGEGEGRQKACPLQGAPANSGPRASGHQVVLVSH